MWNELAFIKQRIDAKVKLDAVVMQAVIGSAFSKEGIDHLKKLLEDL